MRIAILGAECTGKTQLVESLVPHLRDDFAQIACEPDPLHAKFTNSVIEPTRQPWAALARVQMTQVLRHPADTLLLCDTTPLLAAVYSDFILGDTTLYPWALEQQRAFALTLLTGLDVPWDSNGMHRESPAIRVLIDQRLRSVLLKNHFGFSTLYGSNTERVKQARLAILSAKGTAPDTPASHWKWSCEKCSDADCEHRLFSDLLKGS